MKVYTLERVQHVGGDLNAVFDFFADALNLQRITPPWLRFRVVTPGAVEMRAGTLLEYRLRLHGVPVRWLTRIETWEPPHGFMDVQVRGPYRVWRHQHSFEHDGTGVAMSDRVRYALPLGPLGRLAHGGFVRRDLERIFDFRQATVGRAFALEGDARAPG